MEKFLETFDRQNKMTMVFFLNNNIVFSKSTILSTVLNTVPRIVIFQKPRDTSKKIVVCIRIDNLDISRIFDEQLDCPVNFVHLLGVWLIFTVIDTAAVDVILNCT